MSANTAIHMLALPATASTRNTALMPSAMPMFCQSTACVRRDRRMVSGRRRKSSFMMTTSAASIAVCVPAPPIAKPMSDCASAGASLMPSPAIAVSPSRSCKSLMTASLSSGSRLPCTSDMPACAAMARAVATLSPDSMTGVTPKAFSAATAAVDEGLRVSATAQIASTPSADASSVTERPASSCSFSRASISAEHC